MNDFYASRFAYRGYETLLNKLLLVSLLVFIGSANVQANEGTLKSSKEKKASLKAHSVQSMIIKGQVLDSQVSPTALVGVSVMIKGTAKGTTTDANGYFELEVSAEDVLVFTSVGFVEQEYTVKQSVQNLKITLEDDLSSLEEVVVIGYGTQKKVTLSGAVSVLDMKDRENQPLTNPSQALHGVSGLWVNQAGGKPGQDVASIKIRGVGTTNNSNPLVLVDGIEYSMNEVNPNIIESITILKDASAAIYGSRAANGVILVTTKTGKQGKSKINYNFSHGIQNPTMLPDVVWDPILYMQMRNTALVNEGGVPTYTDDQIEEYRQGMATDPYTYPNINWFDYVMDNGYLQQHNLSFSGGNEKVVYNLALGYMDQDGILTAANHANRYSLSLNIKANINDQLTVGGNIIGNYRKYNQTTQGTSWYFNRLMRVLPIFTPYLPDGRYGNVVFATPGRNSVENMEMLLKEGSADHGVQRILTKVYADYKLPLNLMYNINFGLNKLDGYARTFIPFLTSYHPKTEVPYSNYNNISSENYNDNNLDYSFYQTLNWQQGFAGKHNASVMIGTSYQDFETSFFRTKIEGYFDNTLTDLRAGATNLTNDGVVTRDKLASYFGRMNYDFDEKYMIEASFRFDGSARFSRENRWGFFPSASAAWRIDKESFIKDVDFINLMKLRASLGKLGNQAVPLFRYMNTVSLGQDYTFGNTVKPGAAVTSYSDPSISWETTTTYNTGIDLEVWNGKLGLELDVFKKRTSDILRPVNIPAQVGNLGGPQRNIGVVDNTGYEINLSHRNTVRDFTYELSGGLTYVKNKVVDLDGEVVISGRRIIKEGYPIDSYYLYLAEGIYQTQEEIDYSAVVSPDVKPGYLKYRDINGDDKINGDDRVIVGGSIPKYMYSFSVKFGYKGVSLNSFFQGVQGINIYPTANLAHPINNGAGLTKEWVTDSWTPENPNARLPILVTPQGASANYQNSNFWLKDASYLRLQNIQLSYDVPSKWINKVSLNRLLIFVNGQNLLTFSKYKDFDPEKDIKTDNIYDYPMLKTISFGLNATF